MSAPVNVEIDDGEIHWFAGYGPKQGLGLCGHDCQHRHTTVVAWGPNEHLYELDECSECGCRAWWGASEGRRDRSRPVTPYFAVESADSDGDAE